MNLFRDFVQFSQAQMASKDIDPAYPILNYLNRTETDMERALWRTLLYAAYYNIASSETIFDQHPYPKALSAPFYALPMATERRGIRGGIVKRHIDDILRLHKTYGGSLLTWLMRHFTHDMRTNWSIVQENIMKCWGNGRWAAYKLAEILKEVHQFPIEPTDMGNKYSSGPRKGLSLFYPPVSGNTKKDIAILDAQGETLLSRMQKEGVNLTITQLETCLCDFWSLSNGKYYVGHDIDHMLMQIRKAPPIIQEALFSARKAVLPLTYLGECGNWHGVDIQRKAHYRHTGRVLER